MQELIVLAKSGKKQGQRFTAKEFMRRINGKMPANTKYETCSEEAKNRWLSMVNKNKT